MAATLALPKEYAIRIASALSTAVRPPVIWLEFQDCTGDSESFLREPTLIDVLLDKVSLDYHETLMAPSDRLAEKSRLDTALQYPGQYVCIVEGAIPTGSQGVYAMIGGRTALSIAQEVCRNALATIAVGTCAWDGGLGAGYGNYLAYGDWPSTAGAPYAWGDQFLPRGLVYNKNIASAPQPLDPAKIGEYVTHSWYTYTDGDALPKHPSQGETQPNYTGPQPPFESLTTDRYSWLKTPRYDDTPMEVGPLARVLVAYAAGHTQVRQQVASVLDKLGVGADALFSTLGRVAARGIETVVLAQKMPDWITELEANMNGGILAIHNGTKWDPSTWPADVMGWGATEAPRGALGHWIHIKNSQIENYQAVVATTWNGSPRDGQGQRGVWEQALIGTPVADPEKPVEVLRTIHSFDPCMACAVHIVDGLGREVTRVRVET